VPSPSQWTSTTQCPLRSLCLYPRSLLPCSPWEVLCTLFRTHKSCCNCIQNEFFDHSGCKYPCGPLTYSLLHSCSITAPMTWVVYDWWGKCTSAASVADDTSIWSQPCCCR
jgi:hypothetical protein